MGILDKLIEKKDIIGYIKFRRLHLEVAYKRLEHSRGDKQERRLGLKQIKGRIKELNYFKVCINENIKKKSKEEFALWQNDKLKFYEDIRRLNE